jgi:hypothetical protein
VLRGNALWLLPPGSRLRTLLARVISHRHFDNTILLLILFSSLTLAVDTPGLDPNSSLKAALRVLDIVFTALFAAEALLKITVQGFALNGPTSYIRNPWNALDFVIVVVGASAASMRNATADIRDRLAALL